MVLTERASWKKRAMLVRSDSSERLSTLMATVRPSFSWMAR
jgi:hypothetical protein